MDEFVNDHCRRQGNTEIILQKIVDMKGFFSVVKCA